MIKNQFRQTGKKTDHDFGPSWKGNLLAFGFLILTVLGYFYWQSDQAEKSFVKRVSDHSRMLAGMFRLSAENSVTSQLALEKTVQDFLSGSAQFIDYLDSIEPFSGNELDAFAKEANLAGISVIRHGMGTVSGPSGWSSIATCQAEDTPFFYLSEQSLYVLNKTLSSASGCIIIGFDSSGTEKLSMKIGLDRFLMQINKLPLIRYARLDKSMISNSDGAPKVILIRERNNNIAETTMPFESGTLIVGIDANRYVHTINQMQREFIAISIILALMGLFFSWLLFRHQKISFRRSQDFERKLAQQNEEAALGRATATISHEIKNPLNAIGMGLQRLRFETELDDEYKKLVDSMEKALLRTSAIVTNLKKHSQPINLQYDSVSLCNLVNATLDLYQKQCQQNKIILSSKCNFRGTVQADEALLGQVMENLFKNSFEAQPDGGFIEIVLTEERKFVVLKIKNKVRDVDISMLEQMFEPYYTTKIQGTGLGLSLSLRIIRAHGGNIQLNVPEKEVFQVTVTLPFEPAGR